MFFNGGFETCFEDEEFMVFRRRWRWRMKHWMAKMVGLRDTTVYVIMAKNETGLWNEMLAGFNFVKCVYLMRAYKKTAAID